MRIHKLYQCLAAATLLFLPVACDNTDYSEKSPFDNSAYLNVAATKNAETFTFNRKVTSQTKTFTVKLSYPSGDDVKVNLKVDPSLVGAYNAKNDTHYEMLPAEQVDKKLAIGEIEIAPLAFMRGRTLSNAFVILDEAQNTTPMQMKMFLTRLGENSRMVVNGDLSQVDLPRGVISGLKDALDTLENVSSISSVTFSANDVVRHGLVAKIVKAYEEKGKKQHGYD